MDRKTPEKCCMLPSWLWFWFVFYLAMFPYEINYFKSLFRNLLNTSNSSIFGNIPEILPSLALLFGVITVFFPHIRALLLERKFKLVESEFALPKLPERVKKINMEMEDFLKSQAPDLRINVNYNLFTQNCFLYASGYRKTSIALFGGILKLWRLDRKTAESILLHEIGHYRNGDAFIIGAGSSFEWVLRYCLIISTFFFVIPVILVILNIYDTSFYDIAKQEGIFLNSMRDIGMSEKEIIFNCLRTSFLTVIFFLNSFLLTTLPQLLFGLFWLFLSTITAFLPPIAGIWCAELNADRFMKKESGSSHSSTRALDMISENTHLIPWLFSQVSHPPKWLRKWAIREDKKSKSILLFLLLFPLAYFVTLIEPFIRTFAFTIGVTNFTDILKTLDTTIGIYLQSVLYKVWGFGAFFILLWPSIAVYWVRFFSGKVELPNWDNRYEYILSAGIVFCLFVIGYILS